MQAQLRSVIVNLCARCLARQALERILGIADGDDEIGGNGDVPRVEDAASIVIDAATECLAVGSLYGLIVDIFRRAAVST